MFSRDVHHYHGAPRSLQTSKFGAYARLDVPKRYKLRGWCWAIGYGIAIGVMFYLVVGFRAGA
ncbi:hypothetical protein G3N58_17800 [Paraburkholderia sp. Ac-20342]|uniref:hypothetical protein n=1 Tax=Paraburkholderia sp. Ac-20342 TaxID=2703889 RepID=UPI001980E740|nr:hypothetical protein [Paraburkholderia sp. Ac-20342]MBN3848663.1 hypothetical protein [Paraburkholderia sp. Ac-20342]